MSLKRGPDSAKGPLQSPASEQRGDNLKRSNDFCLKAMASNVFCVPCLLDSGQESMLDKPKFRLNFALEAHRVDPP